MYDVIKPSLISVFAKAVENKEVKSMPKMENTEWARKQGAKSLNRGRCS